MTGNLLWLVALFTTLGAFSVKEQANLAAAKTSDSERKTALRLWSSVGFCALFVSGAVCAVFAVVSTVAAT